MTQNTLCTFSSPLPAPKPHTYIYLFCFWRRVQSVLAALIAIVFQPDQTGANMHYDIVPHVAATPLRFCGYGKSQRTLVYYFFSFFYSFCLQEAIEYISYRTETLMAGGRSPCSHLFGALYNSIPRLRPRPLPLPKNHHPLRGCCCAKFLVTDMFNSNNTTSLSDGTKQV